MGDTTRKTQTSTIGTRSPWAPAVPQLQSILGNSIDQYQNRSPNISRANVAIGNVYDNGQRATSYLTEGMNNARSIGLNGGSNSQMSSGMEGMQGFQNIGPSYSEQNLSGMASGDLLSGNPNLQSIIDNSSRDIRESVNENASALGRFGSGAHQSVMGRQVGDMSSGLRYQDFNNQQNQMMRANSMLDSQRLGNIDREMSANNSLFNMGQTTMNNQQGAYDRVGQYAGQINDLNNQTIGAARAGDQFGWQDLNNYTSQIRGIGNMGGVSTNSATKSEPGQSFLQKAAGIASVGAAFL